MPLSWNESSEDAEAKSFWDGFFDVFGVSRKRLAALFPDASLADLYGPLTMPPVLLKAHQANDKAVDAAYGVVKFKTEAERVAFLFEMYGTIAGG